MWSAQKSFAAFYNVFNSIHVLYFLCCQVTENAWKNSGFLKCNNFCVVRLQKMHGRTQVF